MANSPTSLTECLKISFGSSVSVYHFMLSFCGDAATTTAVQTFLPNDHTQYPTHVWLKYLIDRTVRIRQHQDSVGFAVILVALDQSSDTCIAKLQSFKLVDSEILNSCADDSGISNVCQENARCFVANDGFDRALCTAKVSLRAFQE